MNRRRLFFLINLTLVGTGGALIYYLSDVGYSKPREIDGVLAMLNDETSYASLNINSDRDPTRQWGALQNPKEIFKPLYTPTPTPTPTPSPTPQLIAFQNMINSWHIPRMKPTSVTILDQATSEEFVMEINGTKRTVTQRDQTIQVWVCDINIDANPPEIKFCNDRGEELIKVF